MPAVSTSPAASEIAPTTSAFAASTRPRRGVAVSVSRIIPEPYSAVAALTPSTRKRIALTMPPISAVPIGSNSRRPAASHSS